MTGPKAQSFALRKSTTPTLSPRMDQMSRASSPQHLGRLLRTKSASHSRWALIQIPKAGTIANTRKRKSNCAFGLIAGRGTPGFSAKVVGCVPSAEWELHPCPRPRPYSRPGAAVFGGRLLGLDLRSVPTATLDGLSAGRPIFAISAEGIKVKH